MVSPVLLDRPPGKQTTFSAHHLNFVVVLVVVLVTSSGHSATDINSTSESLDC